MNVVLAGLLVSPQDRRNHCWQYVDEKQSIIVHQDCCFRLTTAWESEAKASRNLIANASPFRATFIYPKHSRCAEYLSEREKETFTTKDRETQKECLLPPLMKWLCGWMYMWVQAARSCEWEVGTEWEEKSCFSETISAEARWKAVTLSWLLFVFCTCKKTEFQVVRFVMDGR